MTAPAISVLVVDDQAVVREGLALLLGLLDGIDVIGTAADGDEAVAAAGKHRPDVVLMDLRMPRCDGVEATRRIRSEPGAPEVLVLTTYADDDSLLAALRAGARGYVTKDVGADELGRALAAVCAGDTWIDPAVQRSLVELATARSSTGGIADARLTDREREVLAAMARGESNHEIARTFVITEATVKTHVNNLFAKLGVTNRGQAIAWAWESGLMGGPDSTA
jgi:DNA-binding NarL/FixJ family response regulator